MSRYIAKRALRALLVIWLVVTATFITMRSLGDPVDVLLGASGLYGREDREALRKYLQLDVPLHIQYLRFLRSAVQGDLGRSIRYRQSSLTLVLRRVPPTLVLTAAAMVIALVTGSVLGIVSGIRPHSWADQITMLLALMGLLPAACYAIGTLLFLRFRLNEKEHAEIVVAISERSRKS